MGNLCISKIDNEESALEVKNGAIQNPITTHEIALLKMSWKDIKPEWEKIALLAFQRWFNAYPDVIPFFSPENNSSEKMEEILRCPSVQKHVQRFERMIEKVLEQIDDGEKVNKTLIDLGKFHYEFGAKQTFATSLATSLKFAVCTIAKTNVETENAWDSLFRYISGLLKLGMRQAKEKIKKYECESNK